MPILGNDVTFLDPQAYRKCVNIVRMCNMGEIVVLIRAHVPSSEVETVYDSAQEMYHHLAASPGFLGFSVWQQDHHNGDSLVVLEYTDDQAADKGLECWLNTHSKVDTKMPFDKEPSIVRMDVSNRFGRHLSLCGPNTYLSESFRFAEPGLKAELTKDVETVFNTLGKMEGVISGCYGSDDEASERIIGLATWFDQKAYESSLPKRNWGYQIDFFNRLA